MAAVFISYSREDRDFVLQLVGAFRAHKISSWIDDRLDFGDEWWQTIESEIIKCEYFVVIMSPEARESRWVRREIHVADHHGKKLRPILLRGEPFSMFLGTQFAMLNSVQFVDDHFFHSIGSASLNDNPTNIQPAGFDTDNAVGRQLRLLRDPIDHPDSIQLLATAGAAGDTEIGSVVAKAIGAAGPNGAIVVVEGHSLQCSVRNVAGMSFKGGYLSPFFATEPQEQLVLMYDPYILPFAKEPRITELVPILEKVVAEKPSRPLVFFAESYDEEVLATLVVNHQREIIKTCAVQISAGQPSVLSQIAFLTRATVVDYGISAENLQLSSLGRARIVRATTEETIIIGANETQMLTNGVVVIKVGGPTVDSIKANMTLVAQSLAATKKALEASR